MRHVIWAAWFLIGCCFIVELVHTIDAWADSNSLAWAQSYCRGNLFAEFSPRRTATCMANWLVDAKSWTVYAQGVLYNAHPDRLYLYEVLKVADVILVVVGLVCFAFALACVWANMATQGLLSAIGGLYTLTHGVARLHARGGA